MIRIESPMGLFNSPKGARERTRRVLARQVGLDGVLKDTRFILVRAECPYVQFVVACIISTERFIVGGTNGRERDRSQVSDGKVKRVLRASMLLSYV